MIVLVSDSGAAYVAFDGGYVQKLHSAAALTAFSAILSTARTLSQRDINNAWQEIVLT